MAKKKAVKKVSKKSASQRKAPAKKPGSKNAKPYLHLEKASNEGVCWCECERAIVGVPSQLDCPWCGCGWLFSCMTCGKAFTYAKPVRMEEPLENLVREDLENRGYDKVSASFVKNATAYLKDLLAGVEDGREYVYLDGYVLPVDAKGVEFEGMFAKHALKKLPHADARRDGSVLEKKLGDVRYWASRELPNRDG